MTSTNKHYFLAFLLLVTIGVISCEDNSEEPTPPMLTVSETSIDLGDVFAGAFTTADFTVSGENIVGGVTLEVTGEGYSLNNTSFIVANNDNTATITFSPAADAAVGTSSATITVTAGELSETISVTANVVEAPSTFLESGTEIYVNDFEFGYVDEGHLDSLTTEALDTVAIVLEGVTAVHSIATYREGAFGATFQVNFSMCDDTASDGTADADNTDNDFSCGNAIAIQGAVAPESASVEFALSGLEPGQPAIVTYWLRPNANLERGLAASFTGGETVNHLFDNEDGSVDGYNRTYTQYSITGTADDNGNLLFKCEAFAPEGNTSRATSIDNVVITAL